MIISYIYYNYSCIASNVYTQIHYRHTYAWYTHMNVTPVIHLNVAKVLRKMEVLDIKVFGGKRRGFCLLALHVYHVFHLYVHHIISSYYVNTRGNAIYIKSIWSTFHFISVHSLHVNAPASFRCNSKRHQEHAKSSLGSIEGLLQGLQRVPCFLEVQEGPYYKAPWLRPQKAPQHEPPGWLSRSQHAFEHKVGHLNSMLMEKGVRNPITLTACAIANILTHVT